MKQELIIVLDFGGQYNQLVARRVRECNVYCEVKPHDMSLEEIKAFDPIGIIFTGGPNSVYADNSPHPAAGIYQLGVPILGICYGCQLLSHELGGLVTAAQDDSAREYGKTSAWFDTSCSLFKDLPQESITWGLHGQGTPGLPAGCPLQGLPHCWYLRREAPLLRRPVSPGGEPYSVWAPDAEKLPLQHLSCQRRLDNGRL